MDEDYNTNSVSAQEQIALKLLNNDRIANGLPALTMDPVLSELARIKSNDMRDNRYFAHESPTYGNASAMLKTFGYAFNAVGENIAHHANVEKAQAAFMSSDGHRRNILSSSWTKVGIGVAVAPGGYVYVTQIFCRCGPQPGSLGRRMPSSRLTSPGAKDARARASAPRRGRPCAGSIAASIGVSAGAKTTRSESDGSCMFNLLIKNPSSASSYAAEGFSRHSALSRYSISRSSAASSRSAPRLMS